MSKLKYRNEIKYLISDNEVQIIRRQLESFMSIDENAKNGIYTISSLYFDDYFDNAYYDVDDGLDLKNKYRIRIYDHQDDMIRLECKHKKNAMTAKRSCILTKEAAEILCQGNYLRWISSQPQVLKELTYKMMTEAYKPAVIVEYERIPFVYKLGNVRITLDTNIVSSTNTKDFLNGFGFRRPVLPLGKHLLEVKYDEFLPDFIYACLRDMNLEQISFSKYYLCRKYNVNGGFFL
ncbi:MAG: polyphosphate polymerase domain-containing protein [Erysipelotrichaceae bacterium]|nr:polyphosphate polymerase domain-containing protein [Erysipelotrichaceae bacterium]